MASVTSTSSSSSSTTPISRNWNLRHFLIWAAEADANKNPRFTRKNIEDLKPGDRIYTIENYELVFKCVCGELSHYKKSERPISYSDVMYVEVPVFKDTNGNIINFHSPMYVEKNDIGGGHPDSSNSISSKPFFTRFMSLVMRINSPKYTPKAKENLARELREKYNLALKDVKSAFVVVDLQNGFCESDLPSGGKPGLPVNGSTKIVEPINDFKEHFDVEQVFLTRDAHTQEDITFASTHGVNPFTVIPVTYTKGDGETVTQNEMVWPVHCVVGTEDYDFPQDLRLSGSERIYDKGHGRCESYSAIYNTLGEPSTALLDDLNQEDVRIVFVSGLARDYCVGNTALDLARNGFIVVLLEDCTAFVASESNNAINAKFDNYTTRVYSMESTDITDESDIDPWYKVSPKYGGSTQSHE